MLFDRERELAELNMLLGEPGARLVAVTGRRRLGKTTLLVHWARESQLPTLYWVASHFPASVLLNEFSAQVWQHGNPGRRPPAAFHYDDWSHAFQELALLCQEEQRHIVILDEFPYAIDSEPGLPSTLQNAWDHHLKHSNLCMVLCGSQVGMMERLFAANAPLYGRMAGPLRLSPLPFRTLVDFLPRYGPQERVAVYAILGGVPAYLERFSDRLSVMQNIRRHLFQETGLFRTDPDYLIGEQVRDLKSYQAVLAAIAGGARQPAEIALQAGLPHASSADPYLARLSEMGYVRSELPITIPPDRRGASRRSRYVIADSFLRFYFRFLRPNLDLLGQGLHDAVEARITEQLRAFIGQTAFEELCREWILAQARAGRLPFAAEQVGAHWSPDVQVDVAAISWRDRALLLGESKWGTGALSREVVRDLIEVKAPKVLRSLPDGGAGWQVYYAYFARTGFTPAARAAAQSASAILLDSGQVDEDLRRST